MHATRTLIRTIAAVAVLALVAAPAAEAKQGPVASIALGDKRPDTVKVKAKTKKKAKAKAKKKKTARAASVPCQNTDILPAAENLDAYRGALLCLHNQIRSDRGLPALKDNAKLRKAALSHAAAMVSQGFFEHTSPNGATFVDRILQAGYVKRSDGWTLGENLAWGTGELATPQALMDAWMASAGHKANILKKTYKEVGFGVRLGVPSDTGVGATVTADFGTRV